MRYSFYLAGLVCLMSFSLSKKKKITIWLIGDSTMSIKETKAFPETGWGMPFVYFWDSTVKVDNRARNGRSTASFLEEGLWQPVLENMQEGDYVIIQFGHNDEVPSKKTYTTTTAFRANLEKYISDTRSRKAYPILVTPVARRKFDDHGKVIGTHDVYAGIVRELAIEKKVPLIDLDQKGQELIRQMGEEDSKFLFNFLQPGEHPNYPAGKEDNTHFSEWGARKIAEIVLKELRQISPELNERVIKPVVK